MGRLSIARLGGVAAALGSCLVEAAPWSNVLTTRATTAAENATIFAVTYSYPLTQLAAGLQDITGSVGGDVGVNAVLNEPSTASAVSAIINRPNVDTLYSAVILDLSHADVAITVPDIQDRYYIFPFYDLWGNNYANLGSLTKSAAGKYLVQHTTDASKVGLQASTDAQYQGIINAPTIYGIMLPRILLENNTTDVAKVNQIQSEIKADVINRSGDPTGPALTRDVLNSPVLKPLAADPSFELPPDGVQALLQVLANVYEYNKPLDPTEESQVSQELAAAGISGTTYTAPSGVNFTNVELGVAATLQAIQGLLQEFNNEWVEFPPEDSGSFGTNYAVRAFIANTGYLELVQSEALYPEWFGAGVNDLVLLPNESYVFDFSGKPPVEGFWSLTGYNSSSLLIPNSFNIFAVSDRTSLTFSDGTPVYGGNTSDGPFQVLLQAADNPPPANWTNNWIPTPTDSGTFTVNLRFYGPESPLLVGGSYQYPVVSKQATIVS